MHRYIGGVQGSSGGAGHRRKDARDADASDAHANKARGEQPRHPNIYWRPAETIPGWENMSLERLWHEANLRARERFGTPQTTIEAILHSVRERGLAALKEPENVERLARCDKAARKQIRSRITHMKGHGGIGIGKPPVDASTKKFVEEMRISTHLAASGARVSPR